MMAGEPMFIGFKKGDKVPLELLLHGPMRVAEPDRTIQLEVQRDFFVLIRSDGPPRISYDGVHLAEPGGSFRFGFSNTKRDGQSIKVELSIHQPEDDP